MDLKNLYIHTPGYVDKKSKYAVFAVQYTGPESVPEDMSTDFAKLVNQFMPEYDEAYKQVFPDGALLVTLNEDWVFIHPTDWLVRSTVDGPARIYTDDSFTALHTSAAALNTPTAEEQLAHVPSALSRANAVNPNVAVGDVAVTALIERLVAEGRLELDRATFSIWDLPHWEGVISARIVEVVIAGTALAELEISANDCQPAYILLDGPAIISKDKHHVTAEAAYPTLDAEHTPRELTFNALNDDFAEFALLMQTKADELGIADDHKSLMKAMAEALTNIEDDDVQITIAVCAMGLHNLGDFTPGELMAADTHDLVEPAAEPGGDIVDIGDDEPGSARGQ